MREHVNPPYPIQVGRRVKHDETGFEGVIVAQPGSDATHVYVLFDGDHEATPCHPGSVEYVEQAA